MELKIPLALAKKVLEQTEDALLARRIEESPYKRQVLVDGTKLSAAALKLMNQELSGKDTDLSNSVSFLCSLRKSKSTQKAINMESLQPAILMFLKQNKLDGYLYQQGDYKSVAPLLVTEVLAESRSLSGGSSRNYIPHVVVTLAYSRIGHSETTYKKIYISTSTIRQVAESLELECDFYETKATKNYDSVEYDFSCSAGIPIEELLAHFSLYKETEDLKAKYEKQLERFMLFLPEFGKQFRVRGYSVRAGYWGSTQGELLLTEGKPGRCVMNTIPSICFSDDEGKSRTSGRRRYYDDDADEADQDDHFSSLSELDVPLNEVTLNDLRTDVTIKLEADQATLAPLHPTLTVFHLDRYENFVVHVNNLAPYKYKDDVDKMLVLPKHVKRLVNMLVTETDATEDEDVIEGKSQSTIITCIGDPGVGKTLTAEVVAEACKKPLYKVPADQLGGNAEVLEATLSKILRRAERWDCVLMIDEANAYVHARGTDIEQNAIVGVFLRRLEYFKGILFLTTNQTNDEGGFDIDDAILSRSAAVIRMGLPTGDLAKRVWEVQAKLFSVELSPQLIDQLVSTYSISGRSIRNLLKLSVRWARNLNEPLSFEHFKQCAQFIPFTHKEKANQ